MAKTNNIPNVNTLVRVIPFLHFQNIDVSPERVTFVMNEKCCK